MADGCPNFKAIKGGVKLTGIFFKRHRLGLLRRTDISEIDMEIMVLKNGR